MSDTYIIIEKPRVFISNYSGEECYEVKLINTQDEKDYRTYIDRNNKNYRKWSDIVHTGEGWVLDNLKVKSKNKRLINADSKINVIRRVDREELADAWHDR